MASASPLFIYFFIFVSTLSDFYFSVYYFISSFTLESFHPLSASKPRCCAVCISGVTLTSMFADIFHLHTFRHELDDSQCLGILEGTSLNMQTGQTLVDTHRNDTKTSFTFWTGQTYCWWNILGLLKQIDVDLEQCEWHTNIQKASLSILKTISASSEKIYI